MHDQQPKHVFISYVRENQKEVDRLCQDLKRHGVKVWLDRNDITPGIFWEDAIRRAIRDGAFFIACFSKEYNERTSTHMNEELNLAIDVLRKRSREQAWFIPVVLSGDVPDWEIYPGKTLQSIQWLPLYEDWEYGIQRIISVIKPIRPELQNLINAFSSEDRDVRRKAAIALGRDSDPTVVPVLIEALKEKDEDICDEVVDSLGEIGLEAVPALIEALKDDDRNIRKYAAEALGEINTDARGAVPALIEAFKDTDEDMREAAGDALEEIGLEAVPALIKRSKMKI